MTAARSSIGSAYKVWSLTTASWLTVGGIKSLTAPDLSAEEIDASSHDSPVYREYINGFRDAGEISIEFAWHNSIEQNYLRDNLGSIGATHRVEYSDGTKFNVTGVIKGFSIKADPTSELIATISIKLTSPITWAISSQNFPLAAGRVIHFIPHDAADMASPVFRSINDNELTGESEENFGLHEDAIIIESAAQGWRSMSPGWTELSPPTSQKQIGGKLFFGGDYPQVISPFRADGRALDPINKSYLFLASIRYDAAADNSYLIDADTNTPPKFAFNHSSSAGETEFLLGWPGMTAPNAIESYIMAGLSETDGDELLAAVLWDHVAGAYTCLRIENDDAPVVSAAIVPAGTPVASAQRTGGYAFSNATKYLGGLFIEFDTLPGDWQELCQWSHDNWREAVKNKSLYPLIGAHAKEYTNSSDISTAFGYEMGGDSVFNTGMVLILIGNPEVSGDAVGITYIEDQATWAEWTDVAQGTTIKAAMLDVLTGPTSGVPNTDIELLAVLSGAPGNPANGNCPSDLTLTEAQAITIAAADWPSVGTIRIDITEIMQVLVDQPDWDGSGVYFVWRPLGPWDTVDIMQISVVVSSVKVRLSDTW